MNSLLPSNLYDTLVYIIPGFLIGISLLFLFSPESLSLDNDRIGLGMLTLFLILSYVFGIIVHRLSGLIIYPLYYYFGEGVLEGIIRDFPDIELVRSLMSKNLGITPNLEVEHYRYALLIVSDKLPKSAEAAEKMMAMSTMSRNLLICFPIFTLSATKALAKHFSRKIELSIFLSVSIILIFVEFILLKSFLSFWSSAVWEVLRGYIVWSMLEN
ncbi:hypothetical protein ACQ4M4_04165 [Leptolyngbya sp. AN02str]|uniref:hypothetical protein n=1 Tax=Leptolyngbya sp. AN02str TaxID=3423363 RepID=UPI003D31DB99